MNPEKILAAAVQLFSRRGYHASSLDIADAVNLNTASLVPPFPQQARNSNGLSGAWFTPSKK